MDNTGSYGSLKDSSVEAVEEAGPAVSRRRMGVEMAVGTFALLSFAFAVSGRVVRESGLAMLWVEPPAEGAAFPDDGQGHVLFANVQAEAACVDYDDDANETWDDCPIYDASSWCSQDISGLKFKDLCPEACADENLAWAMVCAWEAIKSLPASCDGTFQGSITAPMGNRQNDPTEPAPMTMGGKAEMYDCDEHAMCYSCFNPANEGSVEDARYCEAVAAYYGGFGVPYYPTRDYLPTQKDYVLFNLPPSLETHFIQPPAGGFVGANAAWIAINEDWNFWCEPSTLAAIEAGTFEASYRGAALASAAQEASTVRGQR